MPIEIVDRHLSRGKEGNAYGMRARFHRQTDLVLFVERLRNSRNLIHFEKLDPVAVEKDFNFLPFPIAGKEDAIVIPDCVPRDQVFAVGGEIISKDCAPTRP